MSGVPTDIRVDMFGVEESVVRSAGSERDRLGIAKGDLVEEVHRVQERVADAGVQILLSQSGALSAGPGRLWLAGNRGKRGCGCAAGAAGIHRSASRSRSTGSRFASMS